MTCPVRTHQLTPQPLFQLLAAPGKTHISSQPEMRDGVRSTLKIGSRANPGFWNVVPLRQLGRVYHFRLAHKTVTATSKLFMGIRQPVAKRPGRDFQRKWRRANDPDLIVSSRLSSPPEPW